MYARGFGVGGMGKDYLWASLKGKCRWNFKRGQNFLYFANESVEIKKHAICWRGGGSWKLNKGKLKFWEIKREYQSLEGNLGKFEDI